MLIVSGIFLWFSSNSGASMIESFALALAVGIAVNMFIAIAVTRTFLRFLFALAGPMLRKSKWLLGI